MASVPRVTSDFGAAALGHHSPNYERGLGAGPWAPVELGSSA